MRETYIDSNGDTTQVFYGICGCNVWPIAAVMYPTKFGKCGRCCEIPQIMPELTSKQQGLDMFYEWYGHYPDPFEK